MRQQSDRAMVIFGIRIVVKPFMKGTRAREDL